MIRRPRRISGLFSHVCLMLAALAIALKVLVPTGFMTAAPTGGLPFALVICTAQGAVTLQPGEALGANDHGAPAGKTGHDSPCAFAGHGLGAPPPNLTDSVQVAFVAYRAPEPRSLTGLAPGRGLAAPPLPARGPPTLLI